MEIENNNIYEPLLDPKNNRLVIFPIQYEEIWKLYKKMRSAFWVPEEIDFSNDINDWENKLLESIKTYDKPTIIFIDNNKITLTWNPPTNDGGNSIKSYNLSYSPAGTDGISNISIPITNILSQIYSQTINNLVNGTQYTFNLVAYNSSLTPGQSSVVTCTPLGPPSSPSLSILFSLDSSNNVITTLKWTRPTNNGGSSIITYKIMYGINNSNMTLWNPTIPFTGDSYQTDITGLLVGSIYTFSITAVNIFGEGLPGKITSSIGSPPDTPVLDTNNIIPSDYFPGTINNSGIPTSPSTYSCTIKWFPSQSLLPITGYPGSRGAHLRSDSPHTRICIPGAESSAYH